MHTYTLPVHSYTLPVHTYTLPVHTLLCRWTPYFAGGHPTLPVHTYTLPVHTLLCRWTPYFAGGHPTLPVHTLLCRWTPYFAGGHPTLPVLFFTHFSDKLINTCRLYISNSFYKLATTIYTKQLIFIIIINGEHIKQRSIDWKNSIFWRWYRLQNNFKFDRKPWTNLLRLGQ